MREGSPKLHQLGLDKVDHLNNNLINMTQKGSRITLINLIKEHINFLIDFKLFTFILQFLNIFLGVLVDELIPSNFLYQRLDEIAVEGLLLGLL